jgi:hypothetical protein
VKLSRTRLDHLSSLTLELTMRRLAQRYFVLMATAALLSSCDDSSTQSLVDVDGSLASIAAGTQLAAASNVVAEATTDSRVDVRWTDNSDNETGFEVLRSQTGPTGAFAVIATTGRNVVYYGNVNVSPVTQYCYAVRGFRVSGNKRTESPLSNVACVTTPIGPPQIPEAPSNLTAVATSQTQVDLTWQDNSVVETGFQVLRSRGSYVDLNVTTAANASSYRDASAQPATEYCYTIRAVNTLTVGNGVLFSYSPPSNTVCVTTPAVPLPTSPPPSAYTTSAAAVNSSEIAIGVVWTDPSDQPFFRTYRSANAGASWELIGERVYQDYGRPSEQATCYRVVAFNAAGDAAPSNTSCATPMAAPTNLVATRLDLSTARFTWSDNSALEDGYELWGDWSAGSCCPDQPGWCDAGAQTDKTLIASLPAGATSYTYYASTFCDIVDYPYYSYYVVARKGTGLSSLSNEVQSPFRYEE